VTQVESFKVARWQSFKVGAVPFGINSGMPAPEVSSLPESRPKGITPRDMGSAMNTLTSKLNRFNCDIYRQCFQLDTRNLLHSR
jgi:hypothetical protein